MKKIHNNLSNKKKLLIISGVILVLIIATASIFALVGAGVTRDQTNDTSNSANSKGDTKVPADVTDNSDPKTDKPNKSPVNNQPTTTEPENNNLVANITASNQNENTVQIRTLIDGIFNSGTCTLILTKNDNTVTRTSGIQPLANSSTCKGFDIPVSELSTGQWQFTINITIANSEADLKGTVSVR